MTSHQRSVKPPKPAGLWKTLLLVSGIAFQSAQAAEWKEVRAPDEVILIQELGSGLGTKGQVFAQKGTTTSILMAPDLGDAGLAASSDLERYLPLACGCRVKVIKDAMAPADFLIVLATSRSSELLKWLGEEANADRLEAQECLILPVSRFPNRSRGVALIGGNGRGLLNGVYTLLEKSARAWWEPLRAKDTKVSALSIPTETELGCSDQLGWAFGRVRWKPAVNDRVLHLDSGRLTTRTIEWASRNRLSHLVIGIPHELPMTEETSKKLKSLVAFAHGLGLKVLFINMTHRLPSNMYLAPSNPEAIAASTQLFRDIFAEFDIDGMAWHTASEGIKLRKDSAFKSKPRSYWEAKYFSSYYSAIRDLRPDALLVMLMGWLYMNPASELARLFPADTIAWVVPPTPLVGYACADLDEYGKYFRKIWYWLYVGYSQDRLYPTMKLDYLETYLREAILRNHGLAPQGVLFGNNSANAMYFVQVARDGLVSPEVFLESFAERYYGEAQMDKAMLAYQRALQNHLNWKDNIHTTGPKEPLTQEEAGLLGQTIEGALSASEKTRCPLFKDRLKVLAVTALRCLWRGTIQSPHLPGEKGKAWERFNTSQDYLDRFKKMIDNLERAYAEETPDKDQDLFDRELRQIKIDFGKSTSMR